MSFLNILRPLFQSTSTRTTTTLLQTTLQTTYQTTYQTTFSSPSTFVRTLMKSHKGAAKRWRKTSTGWKRSQAARNHGNTGWSRGVLKSDSSKQMANKAQGKRLGKLLPYA